MNDGYVYSCRVCFTGYSIFFNDREELDFECEACGAKSRFVRDGDKLKVEDR